MKFYEIALAFAMGWWFGWLDGAYSWDFFLKIRNKFFVKKKLNKKKVIAEKEKWRRFNSQQRILIALKIWSVIFEIAKKKITLDSALLVSGTYVHFRSV